MTDLQRFAEAITIANELCQVLDGFPVTYKSTLSFSKHWAEKRLRNEATETQTPVLDRIATKVQRTKREAAK